MAQAHLICAMLIWKVGRRGAAGWHNMSGPERASLAQKALLDAMLLRGGAWSEAFLTMDGLDRLQAQLGLEESGFQRLLGQVRRKYRGLARRDLRLGLSLAAGFLLAGGVYGWVNTPLKPIPANTAQPPPRRRRAGE